jgi:ribonuclease T1
MRSIWHALTVTLTAAFIASFLLVAGSNDASAVDTGEIAFATLPREAQQTLQAIKRGGPFAFERDGVVFGNYERRLPQRNRGYYREYTVPTPGVKSRGARRIVSGTDAEYYYSDDHYRTFKRIRE